MMCDECGKIKATVHLTEIVNEQITKLKETFAVLPERGNGALNEETEEYEYVSDDDPLGEDPEP